jgi:hypothetical protein
MPFYPSNIYPNASGVGVSRSGNLTTNNPGSNYINNLTSYQELKDTVVGIGYSYGVNGVLTANDLAGAGTSFFSAARYPTDLRAGVSIISNLTDPLADLTTAVTILAAAGVAYTTSIAGMGASTKMIAASFTGLSFNNLIRKCQFTAWELNRMASDLSLVKSGTGFTFSVSRYPSSQNRFTNTSGGI